MARPIAKFTAAHYEAVARIIRDIVDPEERRKICDLLGHGFAKRSNAFDFYQWRKRCNAER